jgi:non-specific serine/threonine protein kinase
LLLTRLGLGACLADDMGLGKTIQVISLLLVSRKQAGSPRKPSLLVLPASLLANWKAELDRFAPSLTTRFVHPSETDAAELAAMAGDPGRFFANADLVLTTYGMVLRKQWLQEVAWRLLVLDEAQAIKNPGARQTRAVKKLKGDARIALTGTPVENRLSDLWSLFDFLCPGLLGSAARFKQFTKALAQRDHDRYGPLRNLVAPYILRRLKTDKSVIADLPDKTEMKVFCGLAKSQASLYQRSVRELASALAQTEGTNRRPALAYLARLKQICNHPRTPRQR